MTVSRDNRATPDSPGGGGTGSPADADGAVPSDLTADELFHVLQEEQRRDALRYLLQTDGPVEVADLAARVAGRDDGDDEATQRAYIALYQSHLPKLDGLGLVEFDQGAETVAATPATDLVEPYLDPATAPDRRGAAPRASGWRRPLVAANVVSAALLAVAWLGPVATVALSFRVAATAILAIHAALTTALFARRGR